MAENLPGLWWVLVLVGLVAGTLSSSLGVGSALVVIPMLVLVLHFPQKSAQGTSLAMMVPLALFGAILYWKAGNLDVKPLALGLLVAGALAGATVGVAVAHYLPAAVLRKVFAVFVLVVAVWMLVDPGQKSTAAASAGASQPTEGGVQR